MAQQRPKAFRLDETHPLAKGLVFGGFGALAGSSHYHDSSVFGKHGTLDAGASWNGNLLHTVSSVESGAGLPDSPQFNFGANTDFTITVRCAIPNYADTTYRALIAKYWSSVGWLMQIRGNGKMRALVYGTSASELVTLDQGAIALDGKQHTYAYVFRRGVSGTGFRDGVQVGTDTCNAGNIDVVGDVDVGNYSGGNGTIDADYENITIHNRALSLPEIQQLASGDPMLGGLILPPTRKWFPVSGGAAGTSTSPAAVSVAWSVVTPGVTISTTPSPVTATWSAVTPSIAGAISTTPDPVSASWSAVTPSTTVATLVSPATVAWSAVTPTATGTISTEPDPVTVAWSAATPSTTVSVTPAATSAAWSVVAPDTSVGVVATPDPVSVTWSALAPAVSMALAAPTTSVTWSVVRPTTIYDGQSASIFVRSFSGNEALDRTFSGDVKIKRTFTA